MFKLGQGSVSEGDGPLDPRESGVRDDKVVGCYCSFSLHYCGLRPGPLGGALLKSFQVAREVMRKIY